MKAVYLLAVITISVTSFSAHASEIKRINYEGFTVWVDCDKRGAVKFQYNAQHDTGSFKRHKSFHIDSNVSSSCQQISAKTYKQKCQRYDRGHLVPANHLDYSKVAIRQSNFMTNILPQAANMNRGAWLLTEEITECYRDIDELLIIGGVLWGNNPNDDFFTESHGVKTPDAFWKVIIRNNRAIAWIIPNSMDAKRNRLDDYIVTIQELELVTGESIPVVEYLKLKKPEHSWVIPRGCNKG